MTASSLGYIYAVAGRRADAQKIIEELLALWKERYVSSYEIAVTFAASVSWIGRSSGSAKPSRNDRAG